MYPKHEAETSKQGAEVGRKQRGREILPEIAGERCEQLFREGDTIDPTELTAVVQVRASLWELAIHSSDLRGVLEMLPLYSTKWTEETVVSFPPV